MLFHVATYATASLFIIITHIMLHHPQINKHWVLYVVYCTTCFNPDRVRFSWHFDLKTNLFYVLYFFQIKSSKSVASLLNPKIIKQRQKRNVITLTGQFSTLIAEGWYIVSGLVISQGPFFTKIPFQIN